MSFMRREGEIKNKRKVQTTSESNIKMVYQKNDTGPEIIDLVSDDEDEKRDAELMEEENQNEADIVEIIEKTNKRAFDTRRDPPEVPAKIFCHYESIPTEDELLVSAMDEMEDTVRGNKRERIARNRGMNVHFPPRTLNKADGQQYSRAKIEEMCRKLINSAPLGVKFSHRVEETESDNPTVTLIFEFVSSDEPSVTWSYDEHRIHDSNKKMVSKLIRNVAIQNSYLAKLRVTNFREEMGGFYKVLVENYNGSCSMMCEVLKNTGPTTGYSGPLISGDPFVVMHKSRDNVICGVKLGRVQTAKYKAIWKLNGKEVDKTILNHAVPMLSHRTLPSGNYALLEFSSLALAEKGTYSCIVNNSEGSRVFSVDPHVETEFTPFFFEATKLDLQTTEMPAGLVGKMTLCMKYSACTMHHLIIWDMDGNDFTHFYDFNFIGECREKLTHDTYSTRFCFDFGPKKKMRGTIIPKLVLFLRCSILEREERVNRIIKITFPPPKKHRIGDKFYETELLEESKNLTFRPIQKYISPPIIIS